MADPVAAALTAAQGDFRSIIFRQFFSTILDATLSGFFIPLSRRVDPAFDFGSCVTCRPSCLSYI